MAGQLRLRDVGGTVCFSSGGVAALVLGVVVGVILLQVVYNACVKRRSNANSGRSRW